jgi:hypothetical protein
MDFYLRPDAYYALATTYYAAFEEQLRRDLADSFEQYRLESVSRLQRLGPAVDEIVQDLQYRQSLVAYHRAAALDALAENPTIPEARELALAALEDDDAGVRGAAVRLLEKVGRPEDAEAIVSVARRSAPLDADLREAAVVIALRLAPGADGAVEQLIATNDPTIAGLVLSYFHEANDVEAAAAILPLLDSHALTVRRRAVAYVARRVSPERLEGLLELVLKTTRHFYNVIGWIDRLLYAPEPFGAAYAVLADD